MSVAVLKADDELGYWEYSVLTDDGEWNLQLSRTELAGPEHSDHPGMYRAHLNLKWDGTEFFNSWHYDEYPFLTEYKSNGLIVAASVASLAYWYSASAQAHELRATRDQVQELIGSMGEVQFLLPDGGPEIDLDDGMFMKVDDCQRLGPHAKATHNLYMELHHYGMATTTKEWRMATFGKDELEPSVWAQAGDCGHEHE